MLMVEVASTTILWSLASRVHMIVFPLCQIAWPRYMPFSQLTGGLLYSFSSKALLLKSVEMFTYVPERYTVLNDMVIPVPLLQ